MKKNSKLIPIATIMALLLIGFCAPVSADQGMGHGPKGGRFVQGNDLSAEDKKALEDERQSFFQETKDIRQQIYQEDLALRSELAKKNPDVKKAAEVQSSISQLEAEFDRKRLDHFMKMRKIDPDFGKGFISGGRMDHWMMGGKQMKSGGMGCPSMGSGMMGGHHMGSGMMGGQSMGSGMMGPGMVGDNDGDRDCPYGGRSMGPGRGYGMMDRGYGMGSGMMMGRGYGMGPGYGRGQGSMGRAPAQGEIGPGVGRLETPLKEDGARTVVENYLQSTRNPNLKLGKITEQGEAFEAEIVTKDGSLVDKLLVEKSTGWMHPATQ